MFPTAFSIIIINIMVEQVKSFLAADWKMLEKKYTDFSEYKQAVLQDEMTKCANDTEWSLDDKDTEHESFPYFAMCLRNGVAMNTVLNQSRALRAEVVGFHF